jgi:hypothetical protein
MAKVTGCGTAYNGAHTVVGVPLRCGVNLYWKTPGAKPNDKNRQAELLLCEDCQKAGTE